MEIDKQARLSILKASPALFQDLDQIVKIGFPDLSEVKTKESRKIRLNLF